MKRVYDPNLHCGGKTKAGTPCLRFKGQGTDHPRSGKCSKHLGSTRNGRKAALKEAAFKAASGMPGFRADGNPIETLHIATQFAHGTLLYYEAEVGRAYAAGDAKKLEMLMPMLTESTKLMATISKAALDAGVAERAQRLSEREAAFYAAAIADGLREAFGELATVERRTAFARVVGRRLLVLEQDSTSRA